MRTIHFKSGETKTISQEIAEILNSNIIKGCANFQTFSDEKGTVFFILRLDSIAYID